MFVIQRAGPAKALWSHRDIAGPMLRLWSDDLSSDHLKAETYIAWVRGVCGLVTALVLPFLGIDPLGPIMGTVALALVWDAVLLGYVIPRKPLWLQGGFLTATLDTATISVAVLQTGGVQSPFYVVYYAALSVHAIRFSWARGLALMPLVATGYLAAVALHGDPLIEQGGTLVFRLFWGATFPLFVGVAVDRARVAEQSLAEELRRTRALLQAASAPAASLTVDGVLSAVLEQTRRLTESDAVAVRLNDWEGRGPVCRVDLGDSTAEAAFARMVRSSARARAALLAASRPLTGPELVDLVPAVGPELASFSSICSVEVPGGDSPAGCVVIGRLEDPPFGDVHVQALQTFVERAALALQNARLYQQAQTQMDELRGLHEQIVRTERLAVVGELAAKVAHEINNPLTSIYMYNSLLMEEPVGPDEQRRLAGSVQEQVERAKHVVKDILDFSRPHQAQTEIIKLSPAVESGIGLIRHAAAAAGIRVEENYARGLPPVQVDRSQFGQILVNLASNAIDAMEPGGVLTISTGMRGDEVYVEMRDTGPGIPPEHLGRIFEPFFTTKPSSRGTGLGLAVCRTLIAQLHGRITVESMLGGGSAFTVWLPPVLALEGQRA